MTQRFNCFQRSSNMVKAMMGFQSREQAAPACVEALAKLPDGNVFNALLEGAKIELSEKEISDLTLRIMATNAWNRMSVAARTIPGSADKAFGLDKAGL